jgi:cyanophycin synthetase
MKIIDFKLFEGRNIYNHKPVAKLTVSLGRHSEIPTNEIDGFNDKLIKHFPNLKKHTCCLGYEGGFFERLGRGTYLAHVLEHVLIDMQNTFGYDVKYGKTLEDYEGEFNIFLEYKNPDFVKICCKEGMRILNSFIYNDYIDIEDSFKKLNEIKYETDLGLSTKAIVEEARKLGIPITRISDQNLVRLNYGNKARFVQATLLDNTSCVSVDIASDKNLTKSILNDLQIPVPYGYVVSNPAEAFERALDIDSPVVIKPLNSNQGKGVRTNLYTKNEIISSFDIARNYSKKVIIEKFIEGNDYRVLVVGDKVVAAAKRIPATITGDGTSTIKELIEVLNSDPNRGEGHEKPLTKVTINQKTHEVLKKQGFVLRDVPKKDEVVKLCENCNLSTGGTSEDCTDIIHPNNIEFAIKSANALGIHVAGIDFVAKDISKCVMESQGAIIEVNAAPGIRMHLHPSKGKARNVAKEIVEYMFPNKEETNFPLVSVTGTNGKTTVVRLISHTLQLLGKTVGWTSTSGSYINQTCVKEGDNSGAKSARQLLCQNIDAAVFETARGGIIKKGLGYDLADVGIITNIAEDHLGQNDINTLKDLASIKSLVVESIKSGGYAVLNAEDESSEEIAKHIYENIIFFYKDKENIKTDVDKNICVCLENNEIVVKEGDKKIIVENIKNIPITLNGIIHCNIYNCLAAVSALYALKVPIEIMQKGLNTFKQNQGRFELFEFDGFKIMLDYAHNYQGVNQLLQTCKKVDNKRLVGIIGMPNDRLEEDYEKVSSLCAENLDFIYIKEDEELRSRKKGEVIDIFLNEIKQNDFPQDKIVVINSETDALKQAIQSHEIGDLIIVMYENFEPLLDIVNNLRNSNANKSEKRKENKKEELNLDINNDFDNKQATENKTNKKSNIED